ncbi:MAG: hypothetical protein AAF725_23755, partial [Acidobacteriota bacterium]
MSSRINSPRAVCLAAFLTIGLLNGLFSWSVPVWSPRDEIAHYDYVERLGDLSLPGPGDPIADHTFEMTRELHWHQPASFNGLKRSMGLAGRSYEAQQPPLYYALLALPNRVLRSTGVGPDQRIRCLRLFGILAHTAGALLFIPLMATLSRTTGVGLSYGYLFAFLALATQVQYSGTLGNDSLSLLAGNLTLLAMAKFLERPLDSFVLFASAAASAAVWVKLTNVPLVAVPIGIWIYSLRGQPDARPLRIRILSLGPLAAVPALLVWNRSRLGGWTGSSEVASWFGKFVTPVEPTTEFLKLLAVDFFNVQHVWNVLPREWAWGLLGIVFCNLMWLARQWRSQGLRAAILPLVAAPIVSSLFATAALLNSAGLGVHWNSSRHYFGMLPFVYCGLF